MFDDILVPTDGSAGVEVAADHALDVADRFDATVHVLFVADTNRDSVTLVEGDVVDVLETEGGDVVGEVAEKARARGVDYETETLQGDPAETIVDYAERGLDLVVVPTRGRSGFHRYLLGSVTEKVVQLSSVPVLTLRTGGDARVRFPYENVLLATDGSAAADRAADSAIDLAGSLDATLHVLSAIEEAPLGLDDRSEDAGEEFETAAHEAVAGAASDAAARGIDDVVEQVVEGSAYDRIREYVDRRDVDVVVLGTTGERGLDEILLGGVTEKLVRSSPVPVLTVRG